MIGDSLTILRERISASEAEIVDEMFNKAFALGKRHGIRLAGDDRAAELEIAIINWIIASRES